MKEHIIHEKLLFFIPWLIIISFMLMIFNNNFSINGGEYILFFSETMIFIIALIGIESVFYFIMKHFINNKTLLILCSIAFVLSIIGNNKTLFFFLSLLIFSIFYKKRNMKVDVFFEIFVTLLFIIFSILSISNTAVAMYQIISFNSRLVHHSIKKNQIKVDKSLESPNIYWIHTDGMPSTGFIKKYYNNSLEKYHKMLEENGFLENENASFVGGQHTILALNALLNPNYYDDYLKNYLEDYNQCILKSCKTKTTFSYEELVKRRVDNELLKAFSKKGYTTVSITELNSYTSLKTNYAYDIKDKGDKCIVPYLQENLDVNQIYKAGLKIHMHEIRKVMFNKKNEASYLVKENLKCDNNLDSYPVLKKTKYLPVRASVKALSDASIKDKKPKFYFIDNVLVHKYWNYDENGNLIRKYNTDLSDYDNSYLYMTKVLDNMVKYIRDYDKNSIIIIQGDHGIHVLDTKIMMKYFKKTSKEILNMRNSTMSAISIPEKYINGDEKYLSNPLNISRYLINNFVGENYSYIENKKDNNN